MLSLSHFARHYVLISVRELTRLFELFLGPSKNMHPEYISELAHHMLGHFSLNLICLGIPSSDNLFAEFFFKILFFSQEAWLHKIEKAPELGETVLDWSAG
jgi:hypothetical protein